MPKAPPPRVQTSQASPSAKKKTMTKHRIRAAIVGQGNIAELTHVPPATALVNWSELLVDVDPDAKGGG